jgi:phage shock protein C
MSMSQRLFRSRDDRMLAGVAGGLAELWDADPSLVRIVWALLIPLTGGVALVVYIVMAIVVPEEDGGSWAEQSIGWAGQAPPPTTAGSGPPAAQDPASTGAEPGLGPVTAPGPAAPPAPLAGWPRTRAEIRARQRADRWEARAARRSERSHDGRSAATIIGVLLILVGAWYLVRNLLPTIDFDWFWPLVLVGLGVLVLVLAVRPRGDAGSGPGGSGPDAGGTR